MGDQRTQRQQWRATVRACRVDRVREQARRAGEAREAGDDVAACQRWLAAGGLARRYLRDAAPRGDDSDVVAHRRELQALADDADAAVAADEPSVRRRARAGLGLRVAVVGKGGTGKSVIVGTLARLLARRGRSVLACDFDPNPGLAYSLGVPPRQGALADAAVADQPGSPYGRGLCDDLAPGEVVDRHTLVAPDGVRFVSIGKLDDVDTDAAKRTLSALQAAVFGFAEPGWDVIGDLEAGPTTPFEGYHGFADRVLVAVSPTWVSAMTARRLIATVGDVPTDVVANQWRGERLHDDLPPLVRLDHDERVAQAEHDGLAPLDACPDAPLVAELDALAAHLTGEEVVT